MSKIKEQRKNTKNYIQVNWHYFDTSIALRRGSSLGNQDFYKVIKGKKKVEIQAYNLHGTLNLPFEKVKPKAKIPKLKLPTRLIEIVYQENSTTTLLVSLNEGWQISFRIHNASSRVEPSLKFDINLVSAPHTLFTNHIFVNG